MSATPPRSPAPDSHQATSTHSKPVGWARRLRAVVLGVFVATVVAAFAGAVLLGIAVALAYPKLPDVTSLSDYRPKLPLRVYARDGELIGEFGEERRNMTP
ncbi:MAG: penicillin-binding protein, partial [Betaproteobacteria bacterium]|nr:penicillin-binding protein [Betaproteobacteria bacterium]